MLQKTHQAVLLLNLGSPDSYNVRDVKSYLREFLMDKRVIDTPYLIRKLIVEGFIIPSRPQKSAEAYRSIWTEEGSPLMVHTKKLAEKLHTKISLPITLAMRYGNPTPAFAVEELIQSYPSIDEILVVPLYPHYAMSSYETAVEHAILTLEKAKLKYRVLQPFYKENLYIRSLSERIQAYLHRPFDYLLFSYHGLPVRHLKKSDGTGAHCYSIANCCDTPSVAHLTCYKHQVSVTTNKVAEFSGLSKQKYGISFQSRLGKDEWIKPFTAEELRSLPGRGVKKLLVACPAFVSDCLETLEEIAVVGKNTFLDAGGEEFTMIPCLNDQESWVNTLAEWCTKQEYSYLWK